MNNDINELRNVLFDTLRDLRAGKIDVDRAKAVNETAQVLINTVKAEIDHMRIAGGASRFIGVESSVVSEHGGGGVGDSRTVKTQNGESVITQISGAASLTQHRMR